MKAKLTSIEIDKKKDLLILEELRGKVIPKGTQVFCGICGGTCGITNKALSFPFEKPDFMKSLFKNKLKQAKAGIMHTTCGETLFFMRPNWSFIPLTEFLRLQSEAKLKVN